MHCIAFDLTYTSNRFPVHHFRIFHHFQFSIWFKCYRELYKKTNKQLLNRNLCLFVDLQHNKQNNSPALFGGVRVTWSLPFCVKFCRSCLFFCPFVFLALCSFVLFLFGVVLFVLLSFWRCVVWPLSFWRCVVCRFVFLALCCLAFCLFGVVLFVFFLFTPYNYPFGISKLLLVGFVLLGL